MLSNVRELADITGGLRQTTCYLAWCIAVSAGAAQPRVLNGQATLMLWRTQVVLAEGDLNSEQLGLSATTMQQLLEQVDIVIHSAASIGEPVSAVGVWHQPS